ncbi:MAG TPA: hypothetical protein VMD30_00495 [Tepidisphaeraceae bacterium]|nr:hypothetical protein [Tepidisphaeraceae bacterium]
MAASAPAPASIALCVLGMHRSGTSAVARVVNLLGADLGTDLLPPSVDNPRGFWEQRKIVAAHGDLLESLGSYFDDFLPLPQGWQNRPEIAPHKQRLFSILHQQFDGNPLWAVKDPRICRLLPLWHDLLAEYPADPRFVLVLRNPDEIARSLAVRNGYAFNKSLLLTLSHVLEAERHTRGQKRIIVTFDQLLGDWRATMENVAAALHIRWPNSIQSVAAAVAEFLDPRLRHHQSQRATTADEAIAAHHADPAIAHWTWKVHNLLASGANTAEIDAINAEFTAALPRLSAWRQLRSIDQQYMKIEAWGVGLNSEVQRLARDNDALRLELARRTAGAVASPEITAIEQIAAASAKDVETLRQAVAQRDAKIAELETRLRQIDLAQQWQAASKNASGAKNAGGA